MRKLIFVVLALTAMLPRANAADGNLWGVFLASVSVIQAKYGEHKEGNMEILIRGGFSLPPGVTCDTNYITTLRTVDSDRTMFALLTTALKNQIPVNIAITDNPTYTAFPGRCSLVAVQVTR